jgi:ABC-type branched-subunit amino acid transport system substrate-binding protein
MTRKLATAGGIIAFLSVAVVTISGCSSSGGKSPATNSAGGGSVAGSTAGSGSGTGSTTSGAPITIGSAIPIASSVYNQPDAKTGLTSAIASINAAGGVNGHPLKLDFCDTQYSVNGELRCARQLAGDKVSAVVNPYFLADQSGAEVTLLAKAGIPIFGSQGLSPAELNSPDVFPLSSGIPGWTYGAAAQMIQAGATKVSIMIDTNPGSAFSASLVKAALQSAGKSSTTVIADPNSDPTFAAAAAKATAGGVDGVILTPSPVNLPKMISALKQSGYKGKIGSLTVLMPPQVVKALGAAGNGMLADSQVALTSDSTNAGVQKYTADMAKYGKNTITDSSLFNWSAVELFAKAIAGATAFDAKSISAALNAVSTPIDIGTVGPWQTSGVTSPLKSFTRILNPTVSFGVVKNGEIVTAGDGGFLNPFTTLTNMK